jgi:hypothetical protein
MVVKAIDNAVERPTSFPLVEGEIRRVILSKFPFGVFFRVVGDVVRVVAVIDLRSDDRDWHKRLATSSE